jgi:hypothetical protein
MIEAPLTRNNLALATTPSQPDTSSTRARNRGPDANPDLSVRAVSAPGGQPTGQGGCARTAPPVRFDPAPGTASTRRVRTFSQASP